MNILEPFASVRVINLRERGDRRHEVAAQLARIGAAEDARLRFFTAERPPNAGAFPSIGARGCFESHLAIIRAALADGVERLLILEDDLDFAPDIAARGPALARALATRRWDAFYGTPILDPAHERRLPADPGGLIELPPAVPVQTTSCVGFTRAALLLLEPFLAAMLQRPAGSPYYGPMHVDGAYSVFRQAHPALRTLVCRPAIGAQRASRSDIADSRFLLDRFAATRPLANRLRRSLAWLRPLLRR